MAKPNPYADRMFAGVEKKVVDEDALCVQQVADVLHVCISQAARYAKLRVERGEWERVWKKGGKWLIPAYRPKKK